MLSFFKSSALGAAALFAVAPLVSAATVTFQEGVSNALTGVYQGTQDNWLYKGGSGTDNNYGGTTTLQARGNNIEAILLRFDVSALSGKGAIQSATLKLTERENSTQVDDFLFSVYRITDANAAWLPGSESGGAQDGASSWNHLSYNSNAALEVNWAGHAGLTTTTTDPQDANADIVVDGDGNGLAQATYSYGNQSTIGDMNGTVISLTLPASLIQYWIDHPSKNAGLLIKTNTKSSSDYASFASSENTEAPGTGDATFAWRPALTITYTQVPEPASGAMLLMGAGMMGLRRRRQ